MATKKTVWVSSDGREYAHPGTAKKADSIHQISLDLFPLVRSMAVSAGVFGGAADAVADLVSKRFAPFVHNLKAFEIAKKKAPL